jgi:hypothetical protein
MTAPGTGMSRLPHICTWGTGVLTSVSDWPHTWFAGPLLIAMNYAVIYGLDAFLNWLMEREHGEG